MLKLKHQYFGHLMWRTDSLEKTLMPGKIEVRRRRGWQRIEMVGWHHQLDGHEFEQASGVGDGQGSLVCCSPWGHKELAQLSDWTELNWDLNPTNLGPETMKDLHHCIVLPLMENAHSMVANSKDLWGSEQDMKHISNYWSTVIEWRIVT